LIFVGRCCSTQRGSLTPEEPDKEPFSFPLNELL
jgi:hypothetical protein